MRRLNVGSREALEEVVDDITLSRWSLYRANFELQELADIEAFQVVVQLRVFDRDNGEPITIAKSVRVYLPENAYTILEMVSSTLTALIAHEQCEGLHFNGKRVFDPHRTVNVEK
jgi:hypothetical protein